MITCIKKTGLRILTDSIYFYFLQWNIFTIYLDHTSIFIFFHLIPLHIFFHIEKEDKFLSFFYIKRTQNTFVESSDTSARLSFRDSCALSTFSVSLGPKVFLSHRRYSSSAFHFPSWCLWKRATHESGLIIVSATHQTLNQGSYLILIYLENNCKVIYKSNITSVFISFGIKHGKGVIHIVEVCCLGSLY